MSISGIWESEDKLYTVYFIFNILYIEQLNTWQESRKRKAFNGRHSLMRVEGRAFVNRGVGKHCLITMVLFT